METVLELKNIRKTFPGVIALQNMHLSLKKGEIHAIVGENGAGKSTLIKVMAGVHLPDKGEIIVKGKQMHFSCPQDAIAAGIGVVHQETSLFNDLSIMENMFIGRLPRKGILKSVDFPTMKAEAERIFKMLNVEIDVTKPVKMLGIAEKQMLEMKTEPLLLFLSGDIVKKYLFVDDEDFIEMINKNIVKNQLLHNLKNELKHENELTTEGNVKK